MSRHHHRASSHVWGRVRAAVLDRDDYRCQTDGCQRTATEVHHRVPVAQGGAMFDETNLVSLCRDCHRVAHDRRTPEQVEWDRYLQETGSV